MNELFAQVRHHGYIFIFLIVLAEALGVPVPAALALVAGGAAVASGTLRAPTAVVVAVTAMLLGDSLLYVLGSLMGWRLLGFLCRVSVDPETCVLHSAERFYKRGRATLLIAKVIPGLNSMAPPLAGSMKMPFRQFLGLDFLGATAYAFAYGTVGFIFRDFVATIGRGFRAQRMRSKSRSSSPRLLSPLIVSRCTGSTGFTASFHGYRSPSWQRS